MLLELTQQLGAALSAKGVPFKVLPGPERTDTTSFNAERIVIEHAQGGDGFIAITSQRQNPKSRLGRSVGFTLKIYARSKVTGANVWNHRDRAELVLERVLVALDTVARGSMWTQWRASGGAFAALDDLADSTTWGGSLYELQFSIDRAVEDREWPADGLSGGAARPEAELGKMSTSIKVGQAPNGPAEELACTG